MELRVIAPARPLCLEEHEGARISLGPLPGVAKDGRRDDADEVEEYDHDDARPADGVGPLGRPEDAQVQ